MASKVYSAYNLPRDFLVRFIETRSSPVLGLAHPIDCRYSMGTISRRLEWIHCGSPSNG